MACTCNLAAIDRNCARNAPGLKTQLYIACVDDIDSIGAATNHVVSTITMVATKLFYIWNIIRTDNNLVSEPQENGGYNTTLTGFISKQEAAKHNILAQLSSDENYIVVSVDQNGLQEIIGATDHPARITINPVKAPRNGYNVSIVWEGHAMLPYTFSGTPTTS